MAMVPCQNPDLCGVSRHISGSSTHRRCNSYSSKKAYRDSDFSAAPRLSNRSSPSSEFSLSDEHRDAIQNELSSANDRLRYYRKYMDDEDTPEVIRQGYREDAVEQEQRIARCDRGLDGEFTDDDLEYAEKELKSISETYWTDRGELDFKDYTHEEVIRITSSRREEMEQAEAFVEAVRAQV